MLPPPCPSAHLTPHPRRAAAPELLCESEIYGSPVDVWAVGCIFAEILGRRIMFKGASTREQLQIIIDKLGVPPADEMTGITNRIVIDTIHKMGAGKVPTPFAEQFPGASPMAIDLLSRMLTFDQIKRCTVDEALSHPYLWELHSRAREPVSCCTIHTASHQCAVACCQHCSCWSACTHRLAATATPHLRVIGSIFSCCPSSFAPHSFAQLAGVPARLRLVLRARLPG